MSECPKTGWWHSVPIEGACYSFIRQNYTFSEANENCQKIGGQLFEPKDRFENAKIAELAKTWLHPGNNYEWYWIGIHDKGKEGIFVYNR